MTVRPGPEETPTAPVARVLVDVGPAHLDRPFDYRVPGAMAEDARAGVRVKVGFAGRDVAGFVVERATGSDHRGRLAPLRRVVSPEPVLAPEVAELSAAIARRYAGTRSDVLRLAVPPRHARVEREASVPAPATRFDVGAAGPGWAPYAVGPEDPGLLQGLAAGGAPRVVWSALPGEDWPRRLAEAAAATEASGRGAVVCLPDRRDVDRVSSALTALRGEGAHAVLTADLGPAERYRSFLRVLRGAVRVVVGTRAAAFAPVRDLGLVAIWDDGDDLFAEPRAPYPHAREVVLTRAAGQGCAALVGGFARTVEAQYLLSTGWAGELAAGRARIRRSVAVSVSGSADREMERDPHARTTRIPRAAHEMVRDALTRGPVLVQTPRHGYVPGLACERCRTPARCIRCAGPLALGGSALPPACAWCGQQHPRWACAVCGAGDLRAPVRGERRTAEELGRAFPAVRVRTSSGGQVLDRVGPSAAVVVATPGAEPPAEEGYAGVLLLDAWLALARPDLRTDEEALRRWMNAAALARPPGEGGRVVLVGEGTHPVVQALVRWDPAGFASREKAARESARLPPAARLATLEGAPGPVAEALSALAPPEYAEVLGPIEHAGVDGSSDPDPSVRAVVRVPRRAGAELSRALAEVQAARSLRKQPAVRVRVDPVALG